MDQDGSNTKYLTLGNELVLHPDLTQLTKWLHISHTLEICLEFICLILKLGHKR